MSDVEKMPDNPQPSKESIEAAANALGDKPHDNECRGWYTCPWCNHGIEVAQAIDEAYRKGRASMREEAAKMTKEVHVHITPPNASVSFAIHDASLLISDAIRSLPPVEEKK